MGKDRNAGPGPAWAIPAVAMLVAAFTAGPAAAPGQGRPDETRRSAMNLSSTAFGPGGRIPARHTCDGEDLSPPLAWDGVPEGTRSLALIMDDPDAPPGTWVHWVLYNLPAESRGLEEGVPKNAALDDGAAHGVCWGVSSYSRVGYFGPCPPPGSPHRYSFRLYALDAALELEPKASKERVERAMSGHVLASAELVGLYGR